jgi:ArsR family transcriptional regulator, arsenate/arsenite/antimonite-responsive transcriptional repressor
LVIEKSKSMGFQITKLPNYKLHNYQFIMADAAPNLDRFLHAIADPTRRRILSALKEKGGCSLDKETGLCAFDIEQRVKLAQPTVSHHMRILEKAGVVEAKREGHWRWYRRNEKLITEMMRGLKGQL